MLKSASPRPTTFDTLQPFSFGGYSFPFRTYSIHGGVRDKVHEYPHHPGGAPEKLGRRLYEVRVTGLFLDEAAVPTAYRSRYQNTLFTRQLNLLRALFEEQRTETLVISHIGALQAYCTQWDEKADTRNRSGVEVDMVFREDQDSVQISQKIVDISASTFPVRADNFASVVAQVYADAPSPSIFAQINSIANSIIAIKDQADLYGNLISSKIAGLHSMLARADSTVKDLNHPDNIALLESMHQLWESTLDLARDTGNKGVEMRVFVVPVQMGVGDVSASIYGTPSKGTDLMALNPIDDPLAIPAGTKLRYYPAAA